MPADSSNVSDVTTTSEASADARKVYVTFTRKVSDGNYGGVEVSAFVTGNVNAEANASEVASELAALLRPAVSAVLDQLHIEYFYDEEVGVLREVNAPVTTTVVAAATNAAPPENSGVRVINTSDQDGPLPSWLISECNKLGITAIFDNRKTRDAAKNHPYFKEGSKPGEGHGRDGMPKGFYPPKNG